jgi:cellulose synthase/poly-beta-1,6-N-acetylglucosamine synthase-like glycosyltransferase
MIVPIIGFALLCYTACLTMLFIGLVKTPQRPLVPGRMPGVSIVIPFKNEAPNLERLLYSLESQRYNGLYEVILVNDCSTDRYKDVISLRSWSCPIKVIDSFYSPDRKLSSKQQALDLGIRSASFDWIALTDADMVLSPEWIFSLMAATVGGAELVFGHTAMWPLRNKPILGWVQSFQLATLFAVAYALHRVGINGSCMGNNLLVSKKAYCDSGFDAMGYSMVEDRELLLALRKKGGLVAATEPFTPTATTLPCTTFGQYRNQLLRWVYGGFGRNSNLTLFAIVLTCQNLALVGTVFGMLPPGIAILSVANLLATWLFIAAAFRMISSRHSSLLFPAFYPVLLLETVFLPVAFIFRQKVIWKGRRM